MAHLKPSRLAVLFKTTLAWELSTRKDGVVTRLNGTPVELPYATITDLDETPGWLWSTLRLRTAEGDIFLSGAPKIDVRNLIQKITPRCSFAPGATQARKRCVCLASVCESSSPKKPVSFQGVSTRMAELLLHCCNVYQSPFADSDRRNLAT